MQAPLTYVFAAHLSQAQFWLLGVTEASQTADLAEAVSYEGRRSVLWNWHLVRFGRKSSCQCLTFFTNECYLTCNLLQLRLLYWLRLQ